MTNQRLFQLAARLAVMLSLFVPVSVARADIFQWEYINPADPGQGKRPSTTLAPDGAGANAVPSADLSFRNLTKSYLISADVTGGNWAATNLTNADLSQANLTGGYFGAYYDGFGQFSESANLTGANLTGSNLSNTNFGRATLVGANISQTILTGVDFQDAYLTGTNLTGADVRGANFGLDDSHGQLHGTGITAAQLATTASYLTRDLSGIRLVRNKLAGADLAGQNLTGAILQRAILTSADFSQANLTGADVSSATLTDADLRQANLTSADFEYATLTGAKLTNANLTNADFKRVDLTGAHLAGAEVRGADFFHDYYSVFTGGLTVAQLQSTGSYAARDLSGIKLGHNSLANANLDNQNLTGALLRETTLTNARFHQANLTGADLFLADLTAANFSQANLTSADLTAAAVTGANFTGAEVRGAKLWGITKTQLYSTASYLARDLTGVELSTDKFANVNLADQNLTNANIISHPLTNADFRRANLTGASISGTLTGANFTHAEVREAYLGLIAKAQLYSTASYEAHDLTGITVLSDQTNWNLADQNLTGAVLQGTYNNSNFTRANLTSASFNSANLNGANLTQATLTYADLRDATLNNANLTGANVRGANFGRVSTVGGGVTAAQLYSTASYQAGDMTGIGLGRCTLPNIDFANMNLTNARFQAATLTSANFSRANLTHADFSIDSSTLVAADLTGANLSLANLTNANFTGALFFDEEGNPYYYFGTNLTNANLHGADARGANIFLAVLTGANTSNLIQSDGHIPGLNLVVGEKLLAHPGVPIPVQVSGGFSIDPSATFDLTDNDLIVRATAETKNAMHAEVQAKIVSAQHGQDANSITKWDGPGVTSTSARTANVASGFDLVGLGVIRNSDLDITTGLPGSSYTSFSDQPVTPDDVLVKYTYIGDGNLDGVVNFDDYVGMDNAFFGLIPNLGWATGDINFDGAINFDDYSVVDQAFFFQAAPLSHTDVSAVPEPASLALLAAAAALLAAFRNRRKHALQIVGAMLPLVSLASGAHADIYQWEYVNPADPSEGKQPSTTLAPDGAGVNAGPGAYLANRNLTKAYLIDANLFNGIYYDEYGNAIAYTAAPDLSGTNLGHADLTNAICQNANLTGAILTDAEVRGANFTGAYSSNLGGIALPQLYSTASYKAHDLTGIRLGDQNLAHVNLVGQNLTSARFQGAALAGANLSGAVVRETDFSRSYDQQSSTLSGGVTPSQLYLTASYQARDLSGIRLQANELANIVLANQNLGGASFRGISAADEGGGYTIGTNLSGANLSGAVLGGADFYGASLHGANLSQADLRFANFSGDVIYNAYTNLTNANLSAADARGANFLYATLTGANFTNADVRGTNFHSSEISAAQIYSTTSYKTHDLTGIGLAFARLAGANLASQNLTNADFQYATLANALFSQANLANARFRDANLTNADFSQANLSNADFTSDHSSSSDFTNLTDANLSHANLTNADFSGSVTYSTEDGVFIVPDANLTNANLSGADARGANFQYATLTGANTSNMLHADGHIAGLNLAAGEKLIAYAGIPIPVHVSGEFSINPSATFDLTDNDLIVRATVETKNALHAEVQAKIVSAQNGVDANFVTKWDGPGVTSTSARAANVATGFDLVGLGVIRNSDLDITTGLPGSTYTSFSGLPVTPDDVLVKYTYLGDANLDGVVSFDDYVGMDNAFFGLIANLGWATGDINFDGAINFDDYSVVDQAFFFQGAPLSNDGAVSVPEPGTFALVLIGLMAAIALGRRGVLGTWR